MRLLRRCHCFAHAVAWPIAMPALWRCLAYGDACLIALPGLWRCLAYGVAWRMLLLHACFCFAHASTWLMLSLCSCSCLVRAILNQGCCLLLAFAWLRGFARPMPLRDLGFCLHWAFASHLPSFRSRFSLL